MKILTIIALLFGLSGGLASAETFVSGDYNMSPAIYNQQTPSNKGNTTYSLKGMSEFNLKELPLMVEFNFQNWHYPTTSGGFTDRNFTANLDLQINQAHKAYAGVSYLYEWNNFGGPQTKALGFGGEVLPFVSHSELSPYGSMYWYPDNALKYELGVAYSFNGPVFVDAGWGGINYGKFGMNADKTYNGPFIGLGLKTSL